jgi:Icc-related predicted phosphoesterase
MILLISDVHGFFGVINDQITHAEHTFGKRVDRVVVLGDFGLFATKLERFFQRERRAFLRPVQFLDGNHEEFDRFTELLTIYEQHLAHLPRGTVHRLRDHSCLCLGGSSFIDVINTPEPAEIKDHEIDRCLLFKPGEVEIVLTHDSPRGIGVPHSTGWDIHRPVGFPRSRELLEHFSPRLWVFGHHHQWFDRMHAGTRFLGLPISWEGYAILEDDFHLEVVRNRVVPEQSFLKRWFGGLLGG